jgi:hypothetical protein
MIGRALPLILLLATGLAGAEPGAVSLTDRIRSDLAQGREIVVTSYVGLWYDDQDRPEKNLYWGALYGHDALFRRKAELRTKLPFLKNTDYRIVSNSARREDPVVRRVMTNGGKLRVVYLVYRSMERAVEEMANHVKSGKPPASVSDDPALQDLLRRSYLIGYFGHNIYYGGVDSDDLEKVAVTARDLPRGVFFIGCQSARWYPGKFLGSGIEPILFTTTNMAPEGYVAAAMYDSLVRGLSRTELRDEVARAYARYQKLSKVPRGLFVNDETAIRRLAN